MLTIIWNMKGPMTNDYLEKGATVNSASNCQLHRVQTHWLSGKEKVPGAVVSKEGHADNQLEHERTYD